MTFSIKKIFLSIFIFFLIANCGGISKVDTRKVPVNAQERARKNVEEGKGIGINSILKGRTNYEFSTSNPMWRASLEILDFIPMTTVDYAGGMIISDWYTDDITSQESIKITLRFLSNEIRSDSLKVVVHKKICDKNDACKISVLNNSTISQELSSSIIKKAALIEKEDKKKK